MSATEDARGVSRYMDGVWKEKLRASLYALAIAYAAQCKADFRQKQPSGQETVGDFWMNHTVDARNRVMSRSFETKNAVGFFMAHGVRYGIYLELANDRKHEMLRPQIELWGTKYIAAVKELLA